MDVGSEKMLKLHCKTTVNITDDVLQGNIRKIIRPRGNFNTPPFGGASLTCDNVVLEGGTMDKQKGAEQKYTYCWQADQIEWIIGEESVFFDKKDQQITYYIHGNPNDSGVNLLKIPLDRMGTHLVNSDELSGCIFAWLVLDDSVLFLHAGAKGTHSGPGGRVEPHAADILNGLYYVLNNEQKISAECSYGKVAIYVEDLLEILEQEERIKAGQVIFPADKPRESNSNKIQYLSYQPEQLIYGTCLCCITSGEDKTVKISGMMSNFTLAPFQRERAIFSDKNRTESKNCLIM